MAKALFFGLFLGDFWCSSQVQDHDREARGSHSRCAEVRRRTHWMELPTATLLPTHRVSYSMHECGKHIEKQWNCVWTSHFHTCYLEVALEHRFSPGIISPRFSAGLALLLMWDYNVMARCFATNTQSWASYSRPLDGHRNTARISSKQCPVSPLERKIVKWWGETRQLKWKRDSFIFIFIVQKVHSGKIDSGGQFIIWSCTMLEPLCKPFACSICQWHWYCK